MKLKHISAILHGEPWAITERGYDMLLAIFDAHVEGGTGDLLKAATLRAAYADRAKSTNQKAGKAISVVSIMGTLMNRGGMADISGIPTYADITNAVNMAAGDASVGAILLDIDSGGGMVDGLTATADAIYKASQIKPVIAYLSGSGAYSAAYWLASQANAIYMQDKSVGAGSIGVYAEYVDSSTRDDKNGVKRYRVRSGENKAIFDGTPMTDAKMQKLQGDIDYTYDLFLEAVARGRGISKSQAHAMSNGGDEFMGANALAVGLVDGIMSIDDLIPAIQSGNLPQGARAFAANPMQFYQMVSNSEILFDSVTGKRAMRIGSNAAVVIEDSKPWSGLEILATSGIPPVAKPANTPGVVSKESDDMNEEELKQKHPLLYAAIMQQGKQAGATETKTAIALEFGCTDTNTFNPSNLAQQAKDGVDYRAALETRLEKACVALHGAEKGATTAAQQTKAFKTMSAKDLLDHVETLEAQKLAMFPDGKVSQNPVPAKLAKQVQVPVISFK